MSQTKGDHYKLIGTKLDRYEIQSVAGAGGMGIVYRAQHEILKGVVAIKVLRPDTSLNNDTGISMFFDEAVKTVALNHPFIVKVTGADYTPEGLPYMVMEWLDGHTLGDELYKEKTLPVERITVLLDKICEAVNYAHSKNIIHRDLKPGNIMLVKEEGGEESIRVLDFGIAKAMENTVGTNTRIAGSSYYISPEQTVAQGRIDRCTDIYSLGVILYQMLTGKVPFEGTTDGQVLDMHRSLEPVPLRQVNPSIPLGVEEVVLKALAKRAIDRYQSATELARAFRQAAQLASGAIILECADVEGDLPISNVSVYLNGKYAGQTDENGRWQQRDLTPRKYLIEVEAPRYERWNVSERIVAREEVTIPVLLKRQPKGELVISCGVAGAEVEVDGAKIGKTDQTGRLYLETIAAGTHKVKLVHPKYLPSETTVEIAVWQQALSDLALIERPRRQLGKQIWQKVKGVGGNLTPKPSLTESLAHLERKKVAAQSSPPSAIVPTEASAEAHSDFVAPPPDSHKTPHTCDNCGLQIPAGLRFCIECGTPFSQAIIKNEERITAVSEVVESLEIFPKPVTPQFDEHFKDVNIKAINEVSSLEQDQLPYVTLPSIPGPTPKRKKLWTILVAAAGLLLVLIVGIIAYNRNKIPQPAFFDVTLKISPPESQVVIEGRPIQIADAEGNLPLSGLVAGQNVIIRKPCYDDRNWSAQPPSQNSPVEISLDKLKREGMACIPGGKLALGHPSQECSKSGEVTVAPFWMDVTEVTQEQYAKFLSEMPNHPKPVGWVDGSFSADELQLPVTGIRWSDAKAFAQHYGKDLPTEAEWEFAARGGNNDRLYPWGNTFDPNLAHAGQGQQSGPIAVGKRGPNDFGIFDLIGNVWEWTEDSFEGNPCQNPASGLNYKILRGGSFRDPPEIATAYYRLLHPIESKKLSGVGFRCVIRLDR